MHGCWYFDVDLVLAVIAVPIFDAAECLTIGVLDTSADAVAVQLVAAGQRVDAVSDGGLELGVGVRTHAGAGLCWRSECRLRIGQARPGPIRRQVGQGRTAGEGLRLPHGSIFDERCSADQLRRGALECGDVAAEPVVDTWPSMS